MTTHLSPLVLRFCVAAALLTTAATAARGELVVSAESVMVSAGATGSFQVLLTNNSASPQKLNSYQVLVLLSVGIGDTSVEFTSVAPTTIPPYVFDGVGSGSNTTIPAPVFPRTDVPLIDLVTVLDAESTFNVTIAPNTTVGLAVIEFQVDEAAAGGTRTITFSDAEFLEEYFELDINDFDLRELPFTFEEGSIFVIQVVPEPGTLSMLLAGGMSMLVITVRRRKRVLG